MSPAVRPLRFIVAILAASVLPASTAVAAGPSAPKLQSPANDVTTGALPVLTWAKVKGADVYEVQVSADDKFGSIVTGQPIRTANTAATVSKTVADGTYAWRVRGISAKGTVGKWSSVRTIRKQWSVAPDLQTPTGGLAVAYPSQPLVLRWSDVPGAVTYQVSVASDPSLAQLVVGGKPVETGATAFALPGALPPGVYYWAVQPIDAQGHKGPRSGVGKFTWAWSSTSDLPAPTDANVEPRAYDPELSWSPVAGASGYEVEINYDDEWAASSKVCCNVTSIGTTLSPTTLLRNNTYHWRVRALDVNGNPGGWNEGPDFVKTFDAVAPSIPNLRVRDNEADPARNLGTDADGVRMVQHPIVTWDAVPGAGGYEVQVAKWVKPQSGSPYCEWGDTHRFRTPTNSWTPLWETFVGAPGAFASEPTFEDPGFMQMAADQTYCIGVMAVADWAPYPQSDEVRSQLTYVDGSPGSPPTATSTEQLAQVPAFTFMAPEQVPGASPKLTASDYHAPSGVVETRTPVLRWKSVAGAKSYWVVIARDAEFTNAHSVAFTRQPAYAPRFQLEDETTKYHWVVIPSPNLDGSGVTSSVNGNAPRSFDKRSTPPEPTQPVGGTVVSGQPAFRWKTVEGAEAYILEVSTDGTFKDSNRQLDKVTTAATSYTATTTYPVDTVLYWRVSAITGDEVKLTPSGAATFRRTLPTPTLPADNPLGGSTIPILRWNPVLGAVGYEMHVDQADGTSKDFTTRSTAFTPGQFYGTGVWRWQVRAVFPGDAHGAYTEPLPFTRFIPAPADSRALRTKDRVVLSWKPVRTAKEYAIDVSTSSAFNQSVETVTTHLTEWAPNLDSPAYRSGGTLYWRVAAVDDGRNTGAYSTGTLSLTRRLFIGPQGSFRARTPSMFTVQITNGARTGVRGVKVSLSGLGIKRSRTTDRNGNVTFPVRARRKGKLTIRASKKGYQAARTTLRVR
jgi:hypothetical protein